MKWNFIGTVLFCLITTLNAQTLQEQKYRESFWNIYTEALRGDQTAQYQTGVIYERGLGVEKNATQAAEWYEKAAYQGHVDAQYNIAIMYAAGRGVEQNDAKAMMWFALAARAGDTESRHLLLNMIDGKIITRKKDEGTLIGMPAGTELITPITLVCKDESSVCSSTEGSGKCSRYKAKTVFTSKEKKGRFYKISGMVVNHQWQAYEKEGWIAEESVEIRR